MPIDLIAITALIVIAGFLAWRLDREMRKNDECAQHYMDLYEGFAQVERRLAQLQAVEINFATFKRAVEEEGAVDIEVVRLRNANAKLADQLGTVYGRVGAYRDGLLDAGHDAEAEAFTKWLDGSHDDIIH